MKRHRALEPFSRDHNDGLILARHLAEGRASAIADARAAWEDELRDHFAEEERLLTHLVEPQIAARLRSEHAAIAERILALPLDPVGLSEALTKHIRWEERELFPTIEATAGEAQLAELERETEVLEARRWVNDKRRGELVRRRVAL